MHIKITYVHGVSSRRLLACVTFGKSPVERVGKGVFAEVAKNLIVNLESGEVGCSKVSRDALVRGDMASTYPTAG